MSELATLARPYAKAAFQHARQAEKLDVWAGMLSLAAAVASQDKVKQLLDMPSIDSEAKAKALAEVGGSEISDDFANFLRVLADNKRLRLLPQIGEQYHELKAQLEKTVDVEIVTAFALSDAQKDKLAKALATKLERAVELTSRVDENLLGGAVVRAGDTVIDGSVRGRLVKLAESVTA